MSCTGCSNTYQISIKLCLGSGIIPIRLLLGLGFSTANLILPLVWSGYLWHSLSRNLVFTIIDCFPVGVGLTHPPAMDWTRMRGHLIKKKIIDCSLKMKQFLQRPWK